MRGPREPYHGHAEGYAPGAPHPRELSIYTRSGVWNECCSYRRGSSSAENRLANLPSDVRMYLNEFEPIEKQTGDLIIFPCAWTFKEKKTSFIYVGVTNFLKNLPTIEKKGGAFMSIQFCVSRKTLQNHQMTRKTQCRILKTQFYTRARRECIHNLII